MNQELLVTDDQKAVELEACEKRIFSAFRRGLEATYEIGKELSTIDNHKLYEIRGHQVLTEYAKKDLLLDQGAVNRCIKVFNSMNLLEGAGVEMPSNESQLIELARLPNERVAEVWTELRDACGRNEVAITVDRVRKAVSVRLEEPDDEKPKGVKTTIVDDAEALSETGERALNRIKRICGEPIAQAIASGTRQLTERSIIKWAEQKDGAMKTLVYYVIDQGWTVAEAINYEEKTISGQSTLTDLALRARARGGHVAVRHEEFLVTCAREAT